MAAIYFGYLSVRSSIPCPVGTECKQLQVPFGDLVLQRDGDVDTIRRGHEHDTIVFELRNKWADDPDETNQVIDEPASPLHGLQQTRWGEVSLIFEDGTLVGWEFDVAPGQDTPEKVKIEGSGIGMSALAFVTLARDVQPTQISEHEYALCELPSARDENSMCVSFQPAWTGGELPEAFEVVRFWAIDS